MMPNRNNNNSTTSGYGRTKEEAAERRKDRGLVPRLATLNQIPAAEPTNQLGEDG